MNPTGVPAPAQTAALLEWLQEEVARLRERLPALEQADAATIEEVAEADVMRRHVMFHPERFTPSERDAVTERAQALAGARSRAQAEIEFTREQVAFAEAMMASLESVHALLSALPTAATAAPEKKQASAKAAPSSTTLELLYAIESERLRIARDLHDGPAQLLADLVLRAEILERVALRAPEAFVVEMAEFKNLVRNSVADIRRFMFDLRPDSLDDLGLAATMRRVATEYQDRTGIVCRFNTSGEDRRLTAGVEEGIFRIIQEALANVQRHAEAKTVEISLSISGDTASLRIKDDGVGFDPEVAPTEGRRRLGLVGMQERAAALGGKLEVTSSPGKGTEITATFPAAIPILK